MPLGESVAVRTVGSLKRTPGSSSAILRVAGRRRVGHVLSEFERRCADRHRRQRRGARDLRRRGRAEVAGDGRARGHAAFHVPEGRVQRPAARRHFRLRRSRVSRRLPGRPRRSRCPNSRRAASSSAGSSISPKAASTAGRSRRSASVRHRRRPGRVFDVVFRSPRRRDRRPDRFHLRLVPLPA